MRDFQASQELQGTLQEVLGYLNFSAGTEDPKFLRNLNTVFAHLENSQEAIESGGAWQPLERLLSARLAELSAAGGAFRDTSQAAAVLELTFQHLLPAYRQFHRDLLFHQTEGALFRPYFIGRVMEAVLREGAPWDETERIVEGCLRRLNDFVGHRPVAVLENERQTEPYAHEWVRPVPLYVQGAGVASGRYAELIDRALAILNETDPALLHSAWFDPKLLHELALDPRAYDFNHPVNKRPNYHFGQWDPHHIDNHGRYRRFVLQQVTLDALIDRVEGGDLPREELLFEAATVLAGTMLMASGTCGSGPESHDSTVTLSNLLPQIAAYRDVFYRQWLTRVPGTHGVRLQAEAETLRQPLALARQQLNAQLARRRAVQLQHIHLAGLFARLGYAEAAQREAAVVPVASARMVCQLRCSIREAHRHLDRQQLSPAAALLPEIEDVLKRGIECGAMVDPWNVLGFGGNFSLFAAVENSVPDHRVDELLESMELIFTLFARAAGEAAAAGEQELRESIMADFSGLAAWWDRFATTTVQGVRHVSGRDAYQAAQLVAESLEARRQAGSAAGSSAFWQPFVEQFEAPQAFGRIAEILLEKRDLSAALALLVQWLGQADQVGLEDGTTSFHALALRWMDAALAGLATGDAASSPGEVKPATASAQRLVVKFFDYLEANAEVFWEVPALELDAIGKTDELQDASGQADEDDENLYGAAYDEMIYRDSTADGFESELLDSGAGNHATDFELEAESRRIAQRLAFLSTLARLWKAAAAALSAAADITAIAPPLENWLAQARTNRQKLSELLRIIQRHRLTGGSAQQDALLEYDRRRAVKEALLDRIIAATVATSEAERWLAAAVDQQTPAAVDDLQGSINRIWQALRKRDVVAVRRHWPEFLQAVARRPLLYIPLAKGGDPQQIVVARALQQLFGELLGWLPRLGLLRETCQLIETARAMEKNHPPGPGAVTEFDRLFEIGYKAIVESLIESSVNWLRPSDAKRTDGPQTQLIECLQQLTQSLLGQWLSHSRTLRLSVLEKISTPAQWQSVVKFIEQYGQGLFTQRFLQFGNLRAILHQGLDVWLDRGAEDSDLESLPFFQALGNGLSREEAKAQLALVLEAVLENYAEYRDYNSTTTQSDRGEMLHTLLDLLRLKIGYERVNWNLRPVVMAHDVLVRRGHSLAAELWRRAMAERTHEVAEQHLQRLAELQAKHGMRLPSIAARISERFVRPLAIDHLRALVQPALDEARRDVPPVAFSQLQREASALAEEPGGAGLELPDWLAKLEEEVDRACTATRFTAPCPKRTEIPWTRLELHDIQDQLSNWQQTPKNLESKPEE